MNIYKKKLFTNYCLLKFVYLSCINTLQNQDHIGDKFNDLKRSFLIKALKETIFIKALKEAFLYQGSRRALLYEDPNGVFLYQGPKDVFLRP